MRKAPPIFAVLTAALLLAIAGSVYVHGQGGSANSNNYPAQLNQTNTWPLLQLFTTGIGIEHLTVAGPSPLCAVTGAGTTATCTPNVPSTDSLGEMLISSAGTGQAATGTVTITFQAPVGTNRALCILSPSNINTAWNARASFIQTSNGTSSFTGAWDNNAVLLVAANNYNVNYICYGR